LRHGFKAQAERISCAARQALGLNPLDRLDPVAYAKHVGVIVLDIRSLGLSHQAQRQLLVVDNESWSGMTIKEDGITAIIVNPGHAPERQVSTLMHEIAHIVLKHVAVRVDMSAGGILLVSEYSEDDESEADWLAGTLLLPRDTLKYYRELGMSSTQIAKRFGVSNQLCEWRIRMTGVDVQMRRAKSAGR